LYIIFEIINFVKRKKENMSVKLNHHTPPSTMKGIQSLAISNSPAREMNWQTEQAFSPLPEVGEESGVRGRVNG
jgi:hypothetical protein